MTQVPTSPGAAGGLPRVAPISVIGPVLCCVGAIWTFLNYFKLCAGINQIDPSANIQNWTIFVPIYSNLYLSTMIKSLNKISEQRGLGLPPLADNIVINFLLAILPLYQMMQRYNEIADAIEGKRAQP